jgi:hypothetical protein
MWQVQPHKLITITFKLQEWQSFIVKPSRHSMHLYYTTFLGRNYRNKLDCLSLSPVSTLFKNLQRRLQLIRVEPLLGLHSRSRLQALPAKIRLGWRWQKATNTAVFDNRDLITIVKSFIVMASIWMQIEAFGFSRNQ